jgi:hypothetical protein
MSIDDELDALHQAMDQLLDRIVDANPQVRAAEWSSPCCSTTPPTTPEEVTPTATVPDP